MINVKNLNFRYNAKKALFEQLDLCLAPGHIYGLMGKNGSGKSTLLHLLSGLLTPQSGNIEVLGFQPQKRGIFFLQDMFLLPEEFSLPDVSVVKYASLYAPFYPSFDYPLFDKILKEFEIDAKESMNKMSMGQRKKAFIAFALSTSTKILWMDEPTNGLDIPSKTQFRRIMASIATEDKCIVISTHQVRDLDNLIDAMIVLDEHKIVFNTDLNIISQKLNCVSFNNGEKSENILYEEAVFSGSHAIIANTSNEPGRVDMELLFNAITYKNNKITYLFNSEKNENNI